MADILEREQMYMKGIDASYRYEGYDVYRTETIKDND